MEKTPVKQIAAPPETDNDCMTLVVPDQVICPICAAPGAEKKQKWFCSRCGQLLQTCCD